MIDGILIYLPYSVFFEKLFNEAIIHCIKLKYGATHSEKIKYKGLYLTHYLDSNTVAVSGSIHKYWNGGLHNANRFDYTSFVETLYKLEQEFGKELLLKRLSNVEIGMNIDLFMPVDLFLNSLISYGNRPFSVTIEPGKHIVSCKLNQYTYMLYNKAIQHFICRECVFRRY